jgi:hypothetical protein
MYTNEFIGADTEDPYSHIDHFEKVCGTFIMKNSTDRDVKLKFFGHLAVIQQLFFGTEGVQNMHSLGIKISPYVQLTHEAVYPLRS